MQVVVQGFLLGKLLAEGFALDSVTLLDQSREMLERCRDIQAQLVHGRVEAIPFANNEFDVVTCAWTLETVSNVDLALSELLRVTNRGGTLLLTFCTDKPSRGPTDCLMRWTIERRDTGRFLSLQHIIRLIEESGSFSVRSVPVQGPASMLIVHRSK